MLRFVLLTALASLVLAEMPRPEPRYLEEIAEGRVVGGEVARPNAWPWQISLQYQSPTGVFRHTCGGTLVKRGWVMTAAHCVDSPGRTFRVVLGEHTLYSNTGREQTIDVNRVHIHPGWDANKLSAGYDIALLQLASQATLNAHVQLGSLLPSGQVLPHNNPCYITGWGLTATGGSISPVLKQAYMPVVGHDICSTHTWWGSSVKETMVCAGGGIDSGCNGDSGGPMNCMVGGKYVVHGVASFVSSLGCNTIRKPTVYTRVSAYMDWMEGIMV